MLGDLLGRGGMAEVFAGNAMGSHGFQKPVAIKRLLPELANDDVFVERLIGEAKLLVGMQHGNIVSVLDLARDGDDVFLVMEYVDGPSLRQLLQRLGARGLSLGTATYIIQSAAAGLEFAHARPGGAVIHADISPSNLLLTSSGEVRVADFGIARREGNGDGVVEGKWAYMAPEQARGEPLTPRSDVFALGVVLYELITGRHPLGRQVTADERGDMLRVIPPRVVQPSIPVGIDAICMRALAYDPRDRYARMQQLIDAVVDERFANGWREGASDLAQTIRELAFAGAPANPPRTGPVTIVTRSLISQPARISAPLLVEPSSTFEPPIVRADGTPRPRRPSAPSVAPRTQVDFADDELDSVVGRDTLVGAPVGLATVRAHRWTFGVLAAAAVVGAIAAIAMQLGPDDPADDTRVAPVAPTAITVTEIKPEPPSVTEPIVAVAAFAPADQAPAAPATVPTPAAPAAPPAKQADSRRVLRVQPRSTPAHTANPTPIGKKSPGGTLVIASEPWGNVTIDSDLRNAVDVVPTRIGNLSPGTHVIKVKNGINGAIVTRKVTIVAGQDTKLRIRPEDWP